jgi:hypothetical protein
VVDKWHWDRFFSKYFSFLLSLSFHQCSVFIFHSSTILESDSVVK